MPKTGDDWVPPSTAGPMGGEVDGQSGWRGDVEQDGRSGGGDVVSDRGDWVPTVTSGKDAGMGEPTRFEMDLTDQQLVRSLDEMHDPLKVSVLFLFVDSEKGKDAHSGSKDAPLKTLSEALNRVAKSRASKSQIVLRQGIYRVDLDKPLLITPGHSGLTIRNAPGERAVITGAERIKIPLGLWKRVSKSKQHDTSTWAADLKTAWFDGLRLNGKRMVRAKTPNGAPEMSQHSFDFVGDDQMFGGGGKYTSGWFAKSKDVRWIASVEAAAAEATTSSSEKTQLPAQNIQSSPEDWPSVFWPKFVKAAAPTVRDTESTSADQPANVFDPMDGAGARGSYHMGAHGQCDVLSPPIGYFCSKSPPRGSAFTFKSPKGMLLNKNAAAGIRPNPGAIVVAWRGGPGGVAFGNPRWFAWTWRVSAWLQKNEEELALEFDMKTGGTQGAQGSDEGDYFYMENLKSALDQPGEYFYDAKEARLYVVFNGTSNGPLEEFKWDFVRAKELIRIVGTQVKPVKNVQLVGIEFRDSALTWLEPHAEPSAGDWTLPKKAAIGMFGGVENVIIDSCLFDRLDGNAVLLNGYARKVTLTRNEFSWIGGTAIVSWGKTTNCLNEACTRKIPKWTDDQIGPDGRLGNQPRGTKLANNYFREVGVFVKQSAAYFSALSGQALIVQNVFMNSPRSHISFNDGFLGGDVVARNLFINAARESGDHGPINMWDRVPFIREVEQPPEGKQKEYSGNSGNADSIQAVKLTGTVIPLTRVLSKNFILGTYNTQAGLDSDDGASYVSTKRNVFAYGAVGLKSDFGGHDHVSESDLYLMVQSFCFVPGPFETKSHLPNLVFRNNTCLISGNSPFAYGSKCSFSPSGGTVQVSSNRVASKTELKACGGGSLRDALKAHPEHDPQTVVLDSFPTEVQVAAMIDGVLSQLSE